MGQFLVVLVGHSSFPKLLSEIEKYVLQYSGSLIKTVDYNKYMYNTHL